MGSIAEDPGRGGRIPEHSKRVAWQKIDGETVLLHLKAKELLGLNEVAGRVWELADGSNTIDQIVRRVTKEFHVQDEAVGTDVIRFVDELIALGALTLRDD